MFTIVVRGTVVGDLELKETTMIKANDVADELSRVFTDCQVEVFRPEPNSSGVSVQQCIGVFRTFKALAARPYDQIGMLALWAIDTHEDDFFEIADAIASKAVKLSLLDVDQDGFFRMTDEVREDYDRTIGQ